KTGNLDSSLGAADFNPGKHDLGNLNKGLVGLGNAIQPGLVTEGLVRAASSRQPPLPSDAPLMAADKNFAAGPSYAQILNMGNNATNVKGDDQDATTAPFIAPESSKPSIKGSTNAQVWVRFHELPWVYWDRQILSDLARGVGVPIRFDDMTLKAEVQNVGEPSLGEKRIWADEVGEALEFENQVIRRSNNDETLLNAEHQHHNSAIHDVEREFINEKDHEQPQTLMDHGNAHTKVISIDNLEDK
ncbi:hypothetical protein TorRG33x02_352940, partial [Trema orientale]